MREQTPVRTITVEEQEQMGLIRQRPQHPAKFVAPERSTKLEILPAHETSMVVDHPARQQVVVNTNAVDRSKGFQIAITPIAVVVAVLAVVVSVAFESDLLSFASIFIFWVTFAVVYVIGWGMTALATPEAVSFYSAKRQWDVIEREQQERWSHYRWQTGRIQTEQRQPWQDDLRLALTVAGYAVAVILLVIMVWGAL